MRHEARQVPSWLIFDVGQNFDMRFVLFLLVAATCSADVVVVKPSDGDRLAIPFSVRIGLVHGQKKKVLHLPEPKNQVAPQYPRELRLGSIHGSAVIRLEIDREGRVTKCSLLKQSMKEFGDVAIEAARKWSFGAAVGRDEKPTAVTLDYEFVFTVYEEDE